MQSTCVDLHGHSSHDFTALNDFAQLPEAVLVEEAKAGNDEAFANLVNHCDRSIYRMTLRMTRNHEDAEDARQEALLKAYVNLDRFQGRSRFSTWLMRIAMNEALMNLRKRNTRQVSLDEAVESNDPKITAMQIPDPGEHPERLYARREMLETLTEAIESLQPQSRDVFVLREVEQFSTVETAKLLGVSPNAVKIRLRRARLELQDRLSKMFDGLSEPGTFAQCIAECNA